MGSFVFAGAHVGTVPAEGTVDGFDINASNTGIAGRGLTAGDMTAQGFITYSTNGQTVSRKRFTDQVVVTGNNVTLSECMWDVPGEANQMLLRWQGDNGRLEWSTVNPSSDSAYICIFHEDTCNGLTIYRSDVSFGENCLTVEGDNCLVDECYMHDPDNSSDPGGHRDVIELYKGSGHVVRRSRLTMTDGETSVVNIAPWGSGWTVSNVDVYENFIDGGVFHVIVDNQASGITLARFRRNKMGGHTDPGTAGIYVPLNNADGRAQAETEAILQANPQRILWPVATPGENNIWFDCADLSPDNTGQTVEFV